MQTWADISEDTSFEFKTYSADEIPIPTRTEMNERSGKSTTENFNPLL